MTFYKISLTSSFRSLHLPPLLFCVLSFISGIWWVYSSYPLQGLILFFIVIALAYRESIISKHLIPLLVVAFLAGGLLTQNTTHNFESFYTTYNRQECDIRGSVDSISHVNMPFYRSKISLSLHEISPTGCNEWMSSRQNIDVYLSSFPSCEVSDCIEISGIKIKKPENTSFTLYMIRNNICTSIFLKNQAITIVHHVPFSLKRWLHDARKNFYQKLQRRLSPRTYLLFSTIFIGNKDFDKQKMGTLRKQFQVWGISHHLARSGLHLVIFLMLLEYFLRLIPINFTLKQLCILFFVGIYHLLSFPSVSFIRALLALVFIKICTIYDVRINLLHIIALICFITLISNPYHLFFLDFQLSFILTFALAWLNQLQATQGAIKINNY